MEVSLTVESELAEPVAEILARYVPGGVVIESTQIASSPEALEGRAVGPVRVIGYLQLDNQYEYQRGKLEEALWYLGRIRPLPEPRFKLVPKENWAEAWKEHYRPITIGKRLIVLPAWLDETPSDRIHIRIDPGMAFGTGTHPTTQLCLEFLESLLESRSLPESGNLDVIDVGCGTAILAIAALKLGASRALGVDLDPDAIQAASENAKRNGVLETLELGVGSLSEIRAGAFSIHNAQLVFANILLPVLVRLLGEDFSELLAPGGSVILSGILEEQQSELEAALRENNLEVVERRQIDDWVAFVCQLTIV